MGQAAQKQVILVNPLLNQFMMGYQVILKQYQHLGALQHMEDVLFMFKNKREGPLILLGALIL